MSLSAAHDAALHNAVKQYADEIAARDAEDEEGKEPEARSYASVLDKGWADKMRVWADNAEGRYEASFGGIDRCR